MSVLENIKTRVFNKYYELFWRDVPNWKAQTHRLKKHNGSVSKLIRWLKELLDTAISGKEE